MTFREATLKDIAGLSSVRLSVHENKLSNPGLITINDYETYLFVRGKGWLCEIDSLIVAFAIVDLMANNVWALFVKPEYENRGIGKKLHLIMLNWYFNQTHKTIWLSTWPGTRASFFYKKMGWEEMGTLDNNEIKFEMNYLNWKKIFG